MSPRAKKWALNIVRLAVCAAALWFVARGVTLDDTLKLAGGGTLSGDVTVEGTTVRIDCPGGGQRIPLTAVARDQHDELDIEYGLRHAWRAGRKVYLLLALLVFFPVPALQGVRFVRLLRAQNVHLSAWEGIKITFAGNFLNFAAPVGATAGDVAKAYYVSLHTHRKTEAVTTVFLDRAVGLAGLLTTVAVLSNIAGGESRLAGFRFYTLGILAALVAGGLAYLSPRLRARLLPQGLIRRLPGHEHLRRMDQAARALARHKGILLGAFLLTILLQGIAACSLLVIAEGLGMHAGWRHAPEFYVYFCTGSVVQALPGPPQGLGTVELAYRYFFADFGSPAQIVCLALGIRVVGLLAALPGMFAVLTGAYRPKGEGASPAAGGATLPCPRPDDLVSSRED